MLRYFFFALIILIPFVSPAFADVEAPTYSDIIQGHDAQGNEIHLWTSYPTRIIDNTGHYANYRLYQNGTIVTLETANSGSLVFDKTTCSYSLYNNGLVGGENIAKIKGISYTVKGKANGTSTWSNVNSVNNAACSVSVANTASQVTITGSKTAASGTFQIELKYIPGLGIKETLRAYNNNPAWTNNNIGFTEKFQVPQTIKLGNTQYDLSQYNNTVLDRSWITNNQARLLHLTDKIDYDFGYGWANLQDIKITWINNQAFLSLNYLYGNYIVPYQQWIEVDPTFGPSTGTNYLSEANAGASAGCSAATFVKTATNGRAEIQSAGDASNPTCHRAATSFDVTSIPDTISSISLANVTTTTSAPVGTGAPFACNFVRVMNPPATSSAALLWNDISAGTVYVSGNTQCRSAQTYSVSLGSTAFTDIINSIRAGNNTYHIGIKMTSEARDGSGHSITFGTTQLTITYLYQKPDAVTTLHTNGITTTTVGLAWTAPNMNGGTCSGYQINYTTPYGTPNTILQNNTGTCGTSYTVSSLTPTTDYSFRVSARTQLGVNGSGNIINATTLTFNQANYTIGSFNFEANNPTMLPIRYERTDVGNNAHVNVTFPSSMILNCDLRYTYSGTNHTYHNVAGTVISSTEKEAAFILNNATNEITTFHCYEDGGNRSANYVVTQQNFLLLQQIQQFRNGTFGTTGQLGAFDLITLIIIIIAMIGLNRDNEIVGSIFMIIAISVVAYFQIIAWYITIVAGLAVVILLATASTRKD